MVVVMTGLYMGAEAEVGSERRWLRDSLQPGQRGVREFGRADSNG